MNALTFASLRPAGLTAAAIGGVGGSRPPHISIDSNVFSLIDSTGNVKQIPPLIYLDPRTGQQAALVAIDVVFIDANPKPSKIYFDPAKPYNPNVSEPPLCWSDNGVGPSSQAQKPQSPTCAACPNNAIGSAVSKFSGANIKACQDFKKLAAILPNDPDSMIYLMQVKPGSFKNWSTYLNWLKGQKMPNGAAPDLCDVVTRMSFESQGVLKFEPVLAVVEGTPLAQQMIEAWSKKTTDELTGKLDQPVDPAAVGLPASRPQGQLPPPPAPAMAPQPPLSPQGQPGAAAPMTFMQSQPAQEPAKRQGRPRKAKEPEPAPTQPPFITGTQALPPMGAPIAENSLEIPAFLRRAEPAAAPAPNTGVVNNPPAPPAGLAQALAEAFKLPT